MPYVFVSHAASDVTLANALVKLLRDGADVISSQVICTSLDGLGLQIGSGVADSIREKLLDASVVVLLITPTYESRPYCLCELGGAWAAGVRLFPVVAGDVDPAAFKHVLNDVVAGRLRDSSTLDDLRDLAISTLGVDPPTSIWTGARDAFIDALPGIVVNLPPPAVVQHSTLAKVQGEVDVLTERLVEKRAEAERLQLLVDDLVALSEQGKLDSAHALEAVLASSGEMEQFEELTARAEAEMSKYSGVVRNSIYGDYSGFGYEIDPNYRDQIDEFENAVRKRQVENNEDGWAVTPRLHTTTMRGVKESLDRIERFVAEGSQEFQEWYAHTYNHDLEIKSEPFWNEHLGL